MNEWSLPATAKSRFDTFPRQTGTERHGVGHPQFCMCRAGLHIYCAQGGGRGREEKLISLPR